MTKHMRWMAKTAPAVALLILAAALLVAGCGPEGTSAAPTTASTSPAEAVGLYPVTAAGGGVGFMDKTGRLAISATFAEAAMFSEGLAAVRPEDYGLWGYIDKTGAMVIPPQFAEASAFSEGLAAVRLDVNGSWGYANTTGAMVIPPQFGAAHDLSEGLARVRSDKQTGFVDATGKWIISMSEHEAVGEFSGGLALMFDRTTGLYGYITREGDIAIAPTYADAWGFSEGLAAVRLPTDPSVYGYIDKHGEWVIEPQFVDVRPFSEGLAAAQPAVDGAWGYVDVTGTAVIAWNWDEAGPFTLGVARVGRIVSGTDAAGRLNWGYGYIDVDGQLIWQDQALRTFDAGATTTTTPDPAR